MMTDDPILTNVISQLKVVRCLIMRSRFYFYFNNHFVRERCAAEWYFHSVMKLSSFQYYTLLGC